MGSWARSCKLLGEGRREKGKLDVLGSGWKKGKKKPLQRFTGIAGSGEDGALECRKKIFIFLWSFMMYLIISHQCINIIYE